MPFNSEKQRKWMHANKPKMAKKWEKEEESVNEAKGTITVSKKEMVQLHNDGQIEKDGIVIVYEDGVKEERDYKAEYKKYGSSTKAKKYRAELNQYNRKKGTYGNGDGKDASHKGGKIAGFEKESTNRGRREKSRLKKEDIREFSGDQGINVYLGGIVSALHKSGIKPKTAKQMKSGFSVSKNKIGFCIDVEQRGFDKIEKYTLQIEVDKKGDLWYLSGNRPLHMGPWANTNRVTRMFRMLNKIRGFGQTKFGKV